VLVEEGAHDERLARGRRHRILSYSIQKRVQPDDESTGLLEFILRSHIEHNESRSR
jgi:hypothetical protein